MTSLMMQGIAAKVVLEKILNLMMKAIATKAESAKNLATVLGAQLSQMRGRIRRMATNRGMQEAQKLEMEIPAMRTRVGLEMTMIVEIMWVEKSRAKKTGSERSSFLGMRRNWIVLGYRGAATVFL